MIIFILEMSIVSSLTLCSVSLCPNDTFPDKQCMGLFLPGLKLALTKLMDLENVSLTLHCNVSSL